MSNIRAIRTEADYEAALVRVGALMDAEFGTPEGDELDVLTDLVGLYESQHVAIGYPSPIGAIRFRMEQGGLSPRDLVPLIGSRAKVSELLSGKRPLSMQMAPHFTLISVSPPTCSCNSQAGSFRAHSRELIGRGFHLPPWQSLGG